jgi:hypothetical protein
MPKSSRGGAKKGERKRKKRGRKIKAPRVSSNSKILFDVIPFSPSPSYQFKNPFQNH